MLEKAIINAALATTGTLMSMVAGLLVMPHLILQMGTTTYGFWTLIAGLTTYFGILDFGVTAAVSRLVARTRGQGTPEDINQLVSTAIALLATLSAALCLLTWGAEHAFFAVFAVPKDQAVDVTQAIWVVGLTLAATAPLAAFSGLLWAHERFDLLNGVDITAAVLRTVLILTFVSVDRPLLHVAVVTGMTAVLGSVAKARLCYGVSPELKLVRPSRERARELFSFGIWMNLMYVSRTLLPQFILALIGGLLSASAVTTYAVARQLVFYTNDFTNSATQVVAPRAAKLNAIGQLAPQQALLIEGGRVSYALALFFFGGFLALGSYFIQIWQHGSQNPAYALLVILMTGEVLPMSQWVTYSQIVGARRQKMLAYLSLLELCISTCVCWIMLPRYGLFGACVSVAAVSTLVRGVLQGWFGCRLLNVAVVAYIRDVFVSVSPLAAVPIALIYFVARWVQPISWSCLLGLGVAYAVGYVGVVAIPLLGVVRLRALALHSAQSQR